MGLGTHLGRLGGGEFQHNPCSDERINIPMALDIATLEIHVIQRRDERDDGQMMGQFLLGGLIQTCFF